MGAPLELPPLLRITELLGDNNEFREKMSWGQKRLWKRVYREVKQEEGFSAEKLSLVDQYVTALIAAKEHYNYPIAYANAIFLVKVMDDSSATLWLKELKREFKAWDSEEGSDMVFTNQFHANCGDRERYYYAPSSEEGSYMRNLILLSGAKDRHRGQPLLFKKRNLELLFPYYNVYQELTSEELKICEGVVKLHHRWQNMNDSEKEKIMRFVTAYADDIDSALAIIDSRYVDSLDHLDALMTQTGTTSALADGAL